MNRCIAELLGDLCKVHMSGADYFFGNVDFQNREIFNESKVALFFEDFQEMGTTYQIIPADLIDAKSLVNIIFQVITDAAKNFCIAFVFYGSESFLPESILSDNAGSLIPAHKVNQHSFQVQADQLFGTQRFWTLEGHILEIWIVKPAVETVSCLHNNICKKIVFGFINFQNFL